MSKDTSTGHRLKIWIEDMATGRRGLFGVTLASFLESSVLPFPIEALLVPTFHMAKSRAWILASAALVGCILAAISFYFVGVFLQDAVIDRLADYLTITEDLNGFYERLNKNGFWVIFLVSLLPAPIQIATLGSGVAGYPFELFVLAVLCSRMLRYYGLVVLTLILGDKVEGIIRRAPRHVMVIGSVMVLALAVWLLFMNSV